MIIGIEDDDLVVLTDADEFITKYTINYVIVYVD